MSRQLRGLAGEDQQYSEQDIRVGSHRHKVDTETALPSTPGTGGRAVLRYFSPRGGVLNLHPRAAYLEFRFRQSLWNMPCCFSLQSLGTKRAGALSVYRRAILN